jgi:hypothetical protein
MLERKEVDVPEGGRAAEMKGRFAMPLVRLALRPGSARAPVDVRRFLKEARARIARFQRSQRAPAFVASDFAAVYATLRRLEESGLPPGRLFCEWGSGFGVVSCLAAMLGFDARGIEADGRLVAAARRLAADFDLPAEFVRGNFIPRNEQEGRSARRAHAWLSTGGRCGHQAMGLELADLDLVFAYPWPDEEDLVADLFARRAREDALLLTYHEEGGLRLRRTAEGSPIPCRSPDSGRL